MAGETLISAHPVEPAVRQQVLECLRRLEVEHDVRVVFACESGSRGWGFASPDSDYDVRFVYVHRLAWYLAVEPRRDVIEQPISGDLDVNGWDLRKTLGLLRESNPTLLEWLRSPIVYREDAEATARLRALAEAGFSPVRGYHHYVSMAERNFREHLRGDEVRYKKYLYVLRPLLAARWIRGGRGAPPMRFAELAAATLDDRALLDEINRLLAVKMRAGEAATSPRWDGLHAFIESELAAAEAQRVAESTRPDAAALDAFLAETVLQHERERGTLRDRAAALVTALQLRPHPEGGHFREVFRSGATVRPDDGRAARSALTTIDFVLASGDCSAWHRVCSDEVWHLVEGGPLRLWLMPPALDAVHAVTLGAVDGHGAAPRHTVPAGWWQAAEPLADFAYVGATVGPGFDFADFAFLRDDAVARSRLLALRPDLARLLAPEAS